MYDMKVIPLPNEWKFSQRFTTEVTLPLSYIGRCDEAALFDLEKDKAGKAVLFLMEGEEMPEEGYQIEIDTDKIVLHYGSDKGRYYGLVTLFEMIRTGKGTLPCGVIADSPKFEHRGFMLDESRHFFGKDEVKRILDEMAAVKMNRLHWHLSDDQGYRIESKKFPKLNEIGSRRIEPDGSEMCAYYTQEEIQEIVAYARERKIEIIPEIDLPGHTSAIVAAYPELSCDGTPGTVKSVGGIYTHIMSPAKAETMSFLKELLEEVTALFPCEYFHIGGDEAPKSEWEADPACQEMLKTYDLKDMEELQGWMTDQITAMLKDMGKTAIGWNEMLNAGPREGAVGQYWAEFGTTTKMEPSIKAGQPFIFSPNSAVYCDYPYAMVTLRGTYGFTPVIKGIQVEEEQVLGYECALWSERVPDREDLEKKIFPRIEALAENAWSEKKDFENWKERMKEREEILKEKGISFTPVEEADVHGKEGLVILGEQMKAFAAGMMQGGDNIALPPEVLEQAKIGFGLMLHEMLQFAFSEEEIQVFMAQMMSMMAQGN